MAAYQYHNMEVQAACFALDAHSVRAKQVAVSPAFGVLCVGEFTSLITCHERDPDGSAHLPTTIVDDPELANGLGFGPRIVRSTMQASSVGERSRRMHEIIVGADAYFV